MGNIIIEKLISVDETGLPKPPTIRQLQDKDLLKLYSRDMSKDKSKYMSEVGVIYYLGDPKSPPRQRGFSDKECLKAAIENYGLDKDYEPDNLVKTLIQKYRVNNMTEAGYALETLLKSIHLIALSANKINEILSDKLTNNTVGDEISQIISYIDNISKKVGEIPYLTKALNAAYENLKNEEEDNYARGGSKILSSMNADEDI